MYALRQIVLFWLTVNDMDSNFQQKSLYGCCVWHVVSGMSVVISVKRLFNFKMNCELSYFVFANGSTKLVLQEQGKERETAKHFCCPAFICLWMFHYILFSGFFIPSFPKLLRFQEHHDNILKKFHPKIRRHLVRCLFCISSSLTHCVGVKMGLNSSINSIW